jgi:hypothetical protein
MRAYYSALVLFCTLVPAASAGGLLDFLQRNNELQVVTVTDTTPNGALLRPASPANPVFYLAVSTGSHDFGGVIAGDKQPTSREVAATITKVLAKQGYLPATDLHPPTLLLLWTWGTMNTETFNGSGELANIQVNREQLLRFMGADKLGLVSRTPNSFPMEMLLPGLSITSSDAQALNDLAQDNLYVAAIGAYDYQAAVRNESKLLWKTKISCPSRGHWMPEVLPSMLAIAGPYIGRETSRPVLVSASDKFKPDIRIGNATLVEYLESGKIPVIDASQPAAGQSPPDKK